MKFSAVCRSTISRSCIFAVTLCSLLAVQPAMAALPIAEVLIPETLSALTPFGANAGAMVTEVAVKGQPFEHALRVNTFNKEPGKSSYGLTAHITTPLHKGDVLWIAFKSRRLETKRETGEASVTLRFEQLVDGKSKWPSHLERAVSFGTEWTETQIPFVMEKDVTSADVRLVLQFDTYEQSFEISPVSFFNYGTKLKMSDLPRSVVHYGGDDAGAAWRAAAAKRIELLRKGDLQIKVVDAKGLAVKSAKVSVRMTRNAFHWGTATNTANLLGVGHDADMYRENLRKYFNQVVYENEVKSKYWNKQDPNDKGGKIKKADQWLRANGFGIRGHVMVWPSWQHSPHLLPYKGDPVALRSHIFGDIKEMTGSLKGEFDEWDVLNEPFAHHDIIDLFGKPEMVEWFKAARAGEPNVKLFLNDYTMFQGQGPGSPSQAFFDNVKYLKDNGAPINAIGEQGHIGGAPPAITNVLERLDYFSQLGLPIQISEFDINSSDDDFKANYMRDFMTAVYSHPSTIGFVQWGFWESSHWFPVAALWNKDWTIRKNGQVYADLVSKTWWTNFDGKTAGNGIAKLRGFTGDYEITVQYKGKTVKKAITLDNKGSSVAIEL